MNTQKNILVAFVLNLAFSVFEFIGGLYTGSVAIVSDAVHDLGDAASIGFSLFLEKKSKKQPDKSHTYGYARYSVLGSVITTCILLCGSAAVVYNAVNRILFPAEIRYNGMILFAVAGVCVNAAAAIVTREGDSLNQKAVNLHMLEDVLGWLVVLVGAVVMKFTDFVFIDPLMSIGVAVFIVINAFKALKEILDVFLERTPRDTDVDKIREHILQIDGITDVHHIHIWSMDGQNHYATMHVVSEQTPCVVKQKVREELREHGIGHATLELEAPDEDCGQKTCRTECMLHAGHHHGHHHHHHH